MDSIIKAEYETLIFQFRGFKVLKSKKINRLC